MIWCGAPFSWLFVAFNPYSIGAGFAVDVDSTGEYGTSLMLNFLCLTVVFGSTIREEMKDLLD
jgi:hypothetical protein